MQYYLAFKWVLFLITNTNTFAQNEFFVKTVDEISRSSTGLENFGFHGIDQYDLFNDLLPRKWHLDVVSSDVKYYNFYIDNEFRIGDFDPQSDSRVQVDSIEPKRDGRFQVVTLGNPFRDETLAIIARYLPENENQDDRFLIRGQSHRFLIKLKPGEEINLNFLRLAPGDLEFYCLAPFTWAVYNYVTGVVTEREPLMYSRSPLAPDPDNHCTEAGIFERDFCTNAHISSPHCIRVEGEFNGEVALASMSWFFECPEGADGVEGNPSVPEEPMYQYVQVYYPTRDDLFHKALGWAIPTCNPHPDISGQDRTDFLRDENYAFTVNTSDTTRKHKWNAVYKVAWELSEERVDCVGSYDCDLGFLYQKHFICEVE